MLEKDFQRIKEIAEDAANNAQHSLITKAIIEAFKAYGIHDPQQMQKRMVFIDKEMTDNASLRRGWFGGVGGNFATAVVTFILVWVASIKGWFG